MRYRFGDLTLDTGRYELRRAGTLVKLRPKVFDVLTYLIEQRERVVAKQELLEQFWPRQFVSEATLSSCIRAVRKAVRDSGRVQRVIQTLHGRGFRFVAAIEGDRQEWRGSAVPPNPALTRPLAPLGCPAPSEVVFVPNDPESSAPEHLTAAVVDAEYKVVTVLSVGLVGVTALAAQRGPEAMHRLMQACLATAQQVLPLYGGTLTQIAGEGFVALFGAPLADEDHAQRAVLAAVTLQQALQTRGEGGSLAVPLGIGVHTGPVIAGSLGDGAPSAVYRRGRDLRTSQSAAAAGGPRRYSPQHRHPATGAGRKSTWTTRDDRHGSRRCLTAGVPGAWDYAAAIGGARAWGTRFESVRRARAGNGDAARALAARHPGAGTGDRHCRRARHRQVTTALRIRPKPARSTGDLQRRALSGLCPRYAVSASAGAAASALWDH